jgi:TonB-linked SusC/RagA family outer membrane protein
MRTKKTNPFWEWQCIALKKMFLLLLCSLCYGRQLYAQAKDTQFTISVKKASLTSVFSQIEAQSNYRVFYLQSLINKAKPVSFELKNAGIKEVLDAAFKDQPLDYKIEDHSILVRPKGDAPKPALTDSLVRVSGKVITGKDGSPLYGASIKIKGGSTTAGTDANGLFLIDAVEGSLLEISYIGFQSKNIKVSAGTRNNLTIALDRQEATLEEISVVSTGYQQVNVNQTTGAFTKVDGELLNRRISTDVLSKLDGIASGLFFNGTGSMLNSNYTLPEPSLNANNKLGINIRGQSTLSNLVSKDPLIVLDNFPYEGDINNINPDMVESITMLKDAAAASIWGARAGNGVIVITTKKGRYNQGMKLNFTTNFTIGQKPDIFSDRAFLNARSFIAVEDSLYAKGYLNADINNDFLFPVLSPVIAIREKIRKGEMSNADGEAMIEAYRHKDVRNDIDKYIYQPSLNQQYALSMRGGGSSINYALNLGYDNNKTNLKGNGYERFTVNSLNTFKPVKNLEITAGILYSQINMNSSNGLQWGSGNYYMNGNAYYGLYPYMQLADESGHALPIAKRLNSNYIDSTQKLGFLDWNYYPLKEIDLAENKREQRNLILKASIKYTILPSLNAELQYQNERQDQLLTNHYVLGSYYANNLINQYTQYDPGTTKLSYPIPNSGGMMNLNTDKNVSNNIRGQINYTATYAGKHNITALAGAEMRQVEGMGYLRTSYGYDALYGTSVNNLDYVNYFNTNAGYGGTIPVPNGDVSGTLNRFISYYVNGNYIYNSKYLFSVSARKDGANIFGVKTNQKVVPLWSTGLGWEISKEAFYKSKLVPYLKLRTTYGYNGNVYNGTSYTTGLYGTSYLTNLPYLTGLSAPNPQLRWERVKNINIGLDFSLHKNLLSGSIEYFEKRGTDLIDQAPLASTTGFAFFTGNVASTRTRGLELVLNGNLFTTKAIQWKPTLILNLLKDKVIKTYIKQNSGGIMDVGTPWEGQPIYSMFGYKWAGLDAQNGNPLGYLNGKVSNDYAGIIDNFNPDSLVLKGSARPTVMASFRNDMTYKNFSLSVNFVFKGGYYFRRSSTTLNYPDILKNGMHQDYDNRWQHPGDELHTSVPSLTYITNNNRNRFYQFSEQLIEKADHLRLQDIRLGYQFTKGRLLRQTQLYVYVNNIGIVWRANKEKLDPEAIGTSLPNPKTISFGIAKNF